MLKSWTHDNLLAAIKSGTLEEKIKILQICGILNTDGNLSKKYYKKSKNEISRADSKIYLKK